jgi:hypothetical protein
MLELGAVSGGGVTAYWSSGVMHESKRSTLNIQRSIAEGIAMPVSSIQGLAEVIKSVTLLQW